MSNLKIKVFSTRYLFKVKKIYNQSFPKEERFPFFLLILNILRKNSEMYVLLNGKSVSSFIYIINYENMSFILYLATDKNVRSKGNGSYLLNWFTEKSKEKSIFLNIDEVDNKHKNNKIREKRLNFYINNKFFLTDYLSVEKSGNFNILSSVENFNLIDYKKLDCEISKKFFTRASIIKSKSETEI